MSAAIVAHIHDQPVAIVIAEKVPVKLGKTAWPHIRDVDIARAPARGLADIIAIAFNPVAVARLPLISQRAHTHTLLAIRRLHRKVNLCPSLMHKRLMGGRRCAQPLPVHRRDDAPSFKLDAWRTQGARLILRPGIAA